MGLVGSLNTLLVGSLRMEQAFFSLGWVLSKLGARNLVPRLTKLLDLPQYDERQVVGAAREQVAQ